MNIYICDVCEKEIKYGEKHYTLSYQLYQFAVCNACGAAFKKFIAKHKLFAKYEIE